MKTRTQAHKPAHHSKSTRGRGKKPFFQKSSPEQSSSNTGAQISLQRAVVKGQPGDSLEREADHMADAVSGNRSMSANEVSSGLSSGITPMIQRQEDKGCTIPDIQAQAEEEVQAQAEEETVQARGEEEVQAQAEEEAVQARGEEEVQAQAEEEAVQARGEEEVQAQLREPLAAAGASTQKVVASPKRVLEQLRRRRGRGQALPENIRRSMETKFGADFGNIRIHTDSTAVELARALRARAFTQGADIYFNQDRFQPQSPQGEAKMLEPHAEEPRQGRLEA